MNMGSSWETQTIEKNSVFINNVRQQTLFELDRKALLSEAEKYITNFNTLSETEKFTSIMRSENHTIINTLTKYTYACFEKILV